MSTLAVVVLVLVPLPLLLLLLLLLKTMARGHIQSLGGVSMTDSEGLWPQLVHCAPHLSMVPLILDKVQ